MALRGIFTCSREEVDWFLCGMGRFFPEAWRAFAGAVPADERDDLLSAYRTRLNADDPAIHLPAARAWAAYEASCSTLRPNPEAVAAMSDIRAALALARIEAHYLAHGAFLQPGQLLRDVERIRGIPAVIVQGRYDMVCPVATADRLARAWPDRKSTRLNSSH